MSIPLCSPRKTNLCDQCQHVFSSTVGELAHLYFFRGFEYDPNDDCAMVKSTLVEDSIKTMREFCDFILGHAGILLELVELGEGVT